MKQNIIFTALPNGYAGRSSALRVSVAISLQVLDTAAGTKLSALPDMLNWAELINTAKFIIFLHY